MMISIVTRNLLFANFYDSKSDSEMAWILIDGLYDGLQQSHQMAPILPPLIIFIHIGMLGDTPPLTHHGLATRTSAPTPVSRSKQPRFPPNIEQIHLSMFWPRLLAIYMVIQVTETIVHHPSCHGNIQGPLQDDHSRPLHMEVSI